jgi:hypothetical protein
LLNQKALASPLIKGITMLESHSQHSGKVLLLLTLLITIMIFALIYWGLMTQPVGSQGKLPKLLKQHSHSPQQSGKKI